MTNAQASDIFLQEFTRIQITREVQMRLRDLKRSDDTYDDVLRRMLAMSPTPRR